MLVRKGYWAHHHHHHHGPQQGPPAAPEALHPSEGKGGTRALPPSGPKPHLGALSDRAARTWAPGKGRRLGSPGARSRSPPPQPPPAPVSRGKVLPTGVGTPPPGGSGLAIAVPGRDVGPIAGTPGASGTPGGSSGLRRRAARRGGAGPDDPPRSPPGGRRPRSDGNLFASAPAAGGGSAPAPPGPPDGDSGWAGTAWGGILDFYSRTLSTAGKPGVDMYVPAFAIELIAFFYLALAFRFSTTGATLTQRFSGGLFEIGWIVVLLLQFGAIVVQRIAYLFRSVQATMAIMYVTMLCLHVASPSSTLLFLFYPPLFPSSPHAAWQLFFSPAGRAGFPSYGVAVGFYLLKCAAAALCCVQIKLAYPATTRGHYLTRSFSQFHQVAFLAYMSIPFLYEVRTLLDWTFTDTALKFYSWLKLEDIFGNLFIVQLRP
eukprot:tig00000042_g15558.t1